jgi:hypothetical protein
MKIIILFLSLSIKLDSQSITEMMSSYQIFDHPKAKGVNFSLKAPNGWECREADRPNIVKKFVWKTNIFLVLINNGHTFISKNQAKKIFHREDSKKELLLSIVESFKNSQIYSSKVVSIDRYPALEVVFSADIERLGVSLKYYTKQWNIFYEDKIIIIQGISYNKEDYLKYESIYNLMAASITFPDQYNKK